MSFDPNQCASLLSQKGYVPTCDTSGSIPTHCNDFMETPLYHDSCGGKAMYDPVSYVCCQNAQTQEIKCFPLNQTIDDCSALHASDSNWNLVNCYCCCSCFAWDTMVTMADWQVKEIYHIAKGDEVMVASVSPLGGNLSLTWQPGKVSFSAGTGDVGYQPMMVYLVYQSASDGTKDLICSPDQPFLLPDGMLLRAEKLIPGDKLVDKDGIAVEVLLVSIGHYTGGVHHIAVGTDVKPGIDGHLILTGGVVAGDYDLQNSMASAGSDRHSALAARPSLGTVDYEKALQHKAHAAQNARVVFAVSKAKEGQEARLLKAGVFKAYRSALLSPPIPVGARSLFLPDQALDILTNGSQVPISNPIAESIFRVVKSQFAGFYPDITFAYDPLNMEPNLYAYEYFGQRYVLLSGGLARMLGFNYEGIMMAMAWGVACFRAGDPKNAQGYPAIGMADLYAFGVISRNVWIGSPWMTYVQSAMKQWQTILDLVDPAHAGGNPLDPLNDPSLDCRWQCINSGFVGGGLPECAGGEPLPRLALEAATSTTLSTVDLVFSIAVTPESGSDPANYSLNPSAKISAATVDKSTGFNVTLTAALAADTQYELTVNNLTSYIGTDLDPAHSKASFTTPKS